MSAVRVRAEPIKGGVSRTGQLLDGLDVALARLTRCVRVLLPLGRRDGLKNGVLGRGNRRSLLSALLLLLGLLLLLSRILRLLARGECTRRGSIERYHQTEGALHRGKANPLCCRSTTDNNRQLRVRPCRDFSDGAILGFLRAHLVDLVPSALGSGEKEGYGDG